MLGGMQIPGGAESGGPPREQAAAEGVPQQALQDLAQGRGATERRKLEVAGDVELHSVRVRDRYAQRC